MSMSVFGMHICLSVDLLSGLLQPFGRDLKGANVTLDSPSIAMHV